ncbi:MAG: T9SS type A sorting domain-containing protein [Bacteroidales bacterium]|nr:T9SS type A sorting domain-containing protein [Bacteroidales bacterium]
MKRLIFIALIFFSLKIYASSVISDTSFIADCSLLSDDSQNLVAGEFSNVEIVDNKWSINVGEAAEAWSIFATIDFNGKTIDISGNKFLKVKISTNGLAIDGVAKLIFRVYQKDSPGKYITFYSKAEGQSYSEIYDIAQGWPDGVDNTFDFTKIEKVEIATEVNPGAGTITIEELELGTYFNNVNTYTQFIADCSVLTNDKQNLIASEHSTVEIQDNHWFINVKESASAWHVLATVDFNGNLINISDNKYLKVKLLTEGLDLEGTTKLIFRVYQKDSPGKYIASFEKAGGTSYTEEFDLSQAFPDGTDNTFDFTKINKVEIATEVDPGAGTISIEAFELGTHIATSTINQINPPAVIAYPNPAKTYLGLSNISGNSNIEIFNSQGQIVFKQTLNYDSILNIEDFSPGLYFILIENNQVIKIIKE